VIDRKGKRRKGEGAEVPNTPSLLCIFLNQKGGGEKKKKKKGEGFSTPHHVTNLPLLEGGEESNIFFGSEKLLLYFLYPIHCTKKTLGEMEEKRRGRGKERGEKKEKRFYSFL